MDRTVMRFLIPALAASCLCGCADVYSTPDGTNLAMLELSVSRASGRAVGRMPVQGAHRGYAAPVHLRVPESVGVRLNVHRFLVSLQLDGFTKRGSTWYSSGYDRAPVKLLVDVNAAFGSIEVDWIR